MFAPPVLRHCRTNGRQLIWPYLAGGKWKVWVTTNELPSAGTQAQVSITVYGYKGNSGPIPLGYAKGETFQAGNIDEYEVGC